MLLSGRTNFTIALVALILATSACSSSKHKTEALVDPTAELATIESSADKVGSTPEDMMENEVGGADSTNAPAATSTPPTGKDAAVADAFSELQKDANKDTGASNVSDSGSTEVDSSMTAELSSTGATDTYTVKAGDTLMKIAFTLYGDIDRWKDIKEWNKGKLKSNHLKKGTTLHVEAGSFQVDQHEHTYTIKKGDTLANIADDVYGRKKKYKKLQKYNAKLIKNPNVIFAGFTLYYDITPKEVAEAEARHNQKLAGGGGAPTDQSPAPASTAGQPNAAPAWPPSAVNPPPPAGTPAPVANNLAPTTPAPPAGK